jgi:hypothetical protein
MPTRKQRRRDLKSKRHQYEFVYVDADGNELDEPPLELLEQEEQRKKERTNGAKAAGTADKGKKPTTQRGGRREPQPPSWNRALKRGLMLGGVIFALFALTSKGRYASVLPLALLYTLLFVPFTYYIDRFAYKRFLAKTAAGGPPTKPKKKS